MKTVIKKKPYQMPCALCHIGLEMKNALLITASKSDYSSKSWSEEDDDDGIISGHADYESSGWGNIVNDGINTGHQTYESSSWGE